MKEDPAWDGAYVFGWSAFYVILEKGVSGKYYMSLTVFRRFHCTLPECKPGGELKWPPVWQRPYLWIARRISATHRQRYALLVFTMASKEAGPEASKEDIKKKYNELIEAYW